MNKAGRIRLSPFHIMIFGFLYVILLGAFLLSLPVSSAKGEWTSFYESLFTATSATCVTGLIVRDTATYWSVFGKIVILILIETGGMGVVTVAAMISLLLKQKIGLSGRALIQESVSANQLGGIVRMIRFIIRGVLIIEAAGALLLYPVFFREFGPLKGAGYAIFHSISAFCNAGFDLMGVKSPFSSLTAMSGNILLNMTVILLILIGGIGFAAWEDFKKNKLYFRRYTLQTKLLVSTSLVLILVPALLLFFFEFRDLPLKERVLQSLFQAVTPRTAGFNTADYSSMSENGIVMTVFLMLTGGASGSTAGGLKMNTVAVLFISAYAVARRRKDVTAFGRRIDHETILKAGALLIIYLVLSFGAAALLSGIEGLPYLSCLFETTSAVATVGLSMGLTPQLSRISGMILIFLMFFGRLGGLTMFFAAFSERRAEGGRYPEEKLSVG